jgi:hypothetical protein
MPYSITSLARTRKDPDISLLRAFAALKIDDQIDPHHLVDSRWRQP